jgi:hypothetical protein
MPFLTTEEKWSTVMERINHYHGTRDELLHEIEEAKAVVDSPEPLHEDPLEDLVIRGIWSALLDTLLIQFERMNRISGAA